jgi:anti-sigma factor RsiW
MNVNWFRSECRRSRKLARMASAGLLSESERSVLAQHTGKCSECRYYAAELNVVGRSLSAWKNGSASSVVTAELAAQWHKAIQAEAKPVVKAAGPAVSEVRAVPAWSGWDRAVPVSLVLIWLVVIGIHLNTPEIRPAAADGFVPTLREVRVVMEWLVQFRESV